MMKFNINSFLLTWNFLKTNAASKYRKAVGKTCNLARSEIATVAVSHILVKYGTCLYQFEISDIFVSLYFSN